MKSGKNELQLLSSLIIKNLKEEFAIKHLSKNLINTIKIENSDNEIKIYIPAQTYNMLEYKRNKVVVYTSHGSYASRIDEDGTSFMIYRGDTKKRSFRYHTTNHIGYINRVIDKSIQEWSGMIKGTIKKEEM